MWIDTHCHLDAHEFAPHPGADKLDVAQRAGDKGVSMIVIPAVERGNFDEVTRLGTDAPNTSYALGIHPICVPQAKEEDLALLRRRVEDSMGDPNLVAIGEIGLDFFIPMLCEPAMVEKQEHFFREQLRIARDVGLPVLLHVRRSQDKVLKNVRQIRQHGGIAHAFNGSFQQAEIFIDLGFKLGFGGAMTFTRALQIRRLAMQLPLDSIVLETDAPDISPAWIHPARNSPEHLPDIGRALAEMRELDAEEVRRVTGTNAFAAIPRLQALLAGRYAAPAAPKLAARPHP